MEDFTENEGGKKDIHARYANMMKKMIAEAETQVKKNFKKLDPHTQQAWLIC